MRGVIAAVVVSLLFVSPACTADKVPLPNLDPAQAAQLKAYLAEHAQAPADYIVGNFADHDVVFLGEHHYMKHDLELVHALIPRLHAAGVYYLGTEFSRHEEQPLIDSLLALDAYDEMLAREIVFRQEPTWGFQEYVDVYRVVWAFNRTLAPDAPRFHVLGLNGSPRWNLMKTKADRDNDEVRREVWRGQTEDTWATWILEKVGEGEKVLVHCGIHHAFTEYRQPVVTGDGTFVRHTDERAGNTVYDAIGKRAITIYLHGAWQDAAGRSWRSYPVAGAIDALMRDLGEGAYPVAFDTKGTPFGQLTAPGSYYAAGYDDFRLEMFCDGYVFTKPMSAYVGVTLIPDFVNDDNLERARRNTAAVQFRDAPADRFTMSMLKTASLQGYRRFH